MYAHALFPIASPSPHSGLHKHEVLLRPQYKRLIIGQVKGEQQRIIVSVAQTHRWLSAHDLSTH